MANNPSRILSIEIDVTDNEDKRISFPMSKRSHTHKRINLNSHDGWKSEEFKMDIYRIVLV